jgi:hypothetical protein
MTTMATKKSAPSKSATKLPVKKATTASDPKLPGKHTMPAYTNSTASARGSARPGRKK